MSSCSAPCRLLEKMPHSVELQNPKCHIRDTAGSFLHGQNTTCMAFSSHPPLLNEWISEILLSTESYYCKRNLRIGIESLLGSGSESFAF